MGDKKAVRKSGYAGHMMGSSESTGHMMGSSEFTGHMMGWVCALVTCWDECVYWSHDGKIVCTGHLMGRSLCTGHMMGWVGTLVTWWEGVCALDTWLEGVCALVRCCDSCKLAGDFSLVLEKSHCFLSQMFPLCYNAECLNISILRFAPCCSKRGPELHQTLGCQAKQWHHVTHMMSLGLFPY